MPISFLQILNFKDEEVIRISALRLNIEDWSVNAILHKSRF